VKVQSKDDRATRGSRRALVLEEAARALNSRGVSQTSLTEIAERIGVSRAALYYYFEDQQDLVFQSYRRSCEMFARRLNEAIRTGGGAMAIIERFVDGMLASEDPEFASLSEAAFLRPEQRSTIFGLYEAILANITDVLRTGARRGELRPCANIIVAQAIVGLISWIPMARRWRTSDPLSDQDLTEAIKAALREGIATDRRAALEYQPFDLSAKDVPIDRIFDNDTLAAAKQEALLASASWLFNLKGIDATSLEEIALRVGVTKKVIYHNVGDKETLVVACYRRSFKFYEANAARMVAYEGPRIAAVCASAHALTEASLRDDIAPLAPLGGFDALPIKIKNETQASSKRLMDTYIKTYASGKKEGTIRAVPARAFLAIHPGIFQWLPKWFEMFEPFDRQIAARELADLTRIGLVAT
jgi:AcrR family transcriptional regulator